MTSGEVTSPVVTEDDDTELADEGADADESEANPGDAERDGADDESDDRWRCSSSAMMRRTSSSVMFPLVRLRGLESGGVQPTGFGRL